VKVNLVKNLCALIIKLMVFVLSCFGGSRLENLQGIPRIMGSRGKINAI